MKIVLTFLREKHYSQSSITSWMVSSKYHQFKWSNNWTFWTGNCKRLSSHLIQFLNYWGMSKNSKSGREFQEGGGSSIKGFRSLSSDWNILLLLGTINVSLHNHTDWKTNVFSWEVDKQDTIDQNEFFFFSSNQNLHWKI